MTVSTQTSRADYTGNGVTTSFAVPFYFLDNSHLTVLRTQISTGVVTTLVLTTDYGVTGAGVSSGGAVICTTAPTTDQKLSILRSVPLTQLVHYVPNDPFPAATHEQALDQLTMEVQQVNEIAGRALTLPANTTGVSAALPTPSSNKLIGWNSVATGLQNVDISTIATQVAYGTARYDLFSGTGSQTAFTLTANPGAIANLDVSISGVTQRHGIDFTWVSGTTLTFTSAPPAGTNNVLVRYLLGLAQGTSDSASAAFIASGTGAVTRVAQDKMRESVSIKDYGAICNGTSDDTAAVQAAITAIGTASVTLVVPGATKISSGLTFGGNTELQFSNGGYFIGSTGAEILQVQRQIIAGPRQIFSTCAPISTVGCTVFPEWFGAKGDGSTDDKVAIQAAVDFIKNTGGVVQFDARTYNISSNINIGTGGAGSTGQNTTLQGKGYRATALRATSAAGTAIQILGASGSTLQGVSIRELGITKSVAGTGGYGIYAQYTALLKLRDVLVSDYLYGVGLLRATNSLLDKVLVTFSGSTNNWHGFDLNGGGTGAGGNASSVFRDCYCDGTGATGTGSIGFYAYGAYVSDLIFDACETTTVDVGFQFDCGSSLEAGNEDVQMLNCRADMIKSYGTYINQAGVSGTPVSMFTILGGWYNHRSTGAESDSIYLNQCRGVVISGVQFVCFANYTQAYHVKMNACTDIIVSNCLFSDMKYGVYAVNSGYSQISGNRFYAQTGRTATNYIVASGAARMMVTSNVFDGYCTNAVNFDATSSGCGIVGNTANITNITTRFTNNSTGPIGAVDGSTGLNSGV